MEHLSIRTIAAPLIRLGFLIACAAVILWTTVNVTRAEPAGRPVLRAAVTVHGNVVTIGDFFDNPGPLAPTPLFRPPDIGETGTVDAWQVIDAAQRAGLANPVANGIHEVRVTRAGIEITAERITGLVSEAISQRLGQREAESLQVTYASLPRLLQADAASANPVRLASLNWSRTSGGFSAVLIIDRGHGNKRFTITGTAIEMRSVVVPSRTIDRNTTIGRDDVKLTKVPRSQADSRFASSLEDVVGLAARRPLRAGQAINVADVAPPQLVRRGEAVTIIYQVPGLTLTARGQAMESGIDGDMVNVLNGQSRRIVRGSVIGRGKVQIISNKHSVIKVSEVTR